MARVRLGQVSVKGQQGNRRNARRWDRANVQLRRWDRAAAVGVVPIALNVVGMPNDTAQFFIRANLYNSNDDDD